MPPNRSVVINLPNVFQNIRCRTGRYLNSFFPNATSTWNNIISHYQHLPSFEGLKNHIISLIRPEMKSTFGIHNPSHLRYLFQLRVGLSRLRHHKKRLNFADTPFDKCLCKNGIDDTHHYILKCPFYISHRDVLTSCVNEILRNKNLIVPTNSVDLYLYGHSSLSHADNKKIIEATLEYVKNTNRLMS